MSSGETRMGRLGKPSWMLTRGKGEKETTASTTAQLHQWHGGNQKLLMPLCGSCPRPQPCHYASGNEIIIEYLNFSTY